MKSIAGFSVFLTAFLAGVFLAWATTQRAPAPAFQQTSAPVLSQTSLPQKAPPPPAEEEVFHAEIFNLDDNFEFYPTPFEIKLVDVFEIGNNYRQDEVVAKSGETWLGLFREKGKFRLRKSAVKVVPETRPNYGYDHSVRIKTTVKSEPIFLLKNAANLTEGAVTTIYHAPSFEENEKLGIERESLKIGFLKEFKLGDKIYKLKVKAGKTTENRNVSVLIMETGEESQIVLFNSFYGEGDNIGELLWAGDLDMDGKLDLYLSNYTFEKGGFGSDLFLSSKTKKGKLVEIVASFGTAGC